jgi:hypothetical protein
MARQARPALCECAKCFNRTPKATSTSYTRSEQVGSSSSSSQRYDKWNRPTSRSRSQSRSYRDKTYWLCEDCNWLYVHFAEDWRADRRAMFKPLLIAAAVIAAGIAAFQAFNWGGINVLIAAPLVLLIIPYVGDSFRAFLAADIDYESYFGEHDVPEFSDEHQEDGSYEEAPRPSRRDPPERQEPTFD